VRLQTPRFWGEVGSTGSGSKMSCSGVLPKKLATKITKGLYMARSANFHSTELFVLCRRLEDRTRAHHKTFIILPYSYSISCLLKYFGEADLCHFAYCVRDSCPPLLCPLSYATVRSVCRVRAHIPSLGRVSPCIGDKRLKSVTKTHGQCDVRPTVTFPAVVRAPLPFDWYQIILLGDRGTCV